MPERLSERSSERLLAGYPAAAGAYDEMLDAQQRPRAHWRALLDSLRAEPEGSMPARIDAVRRQVRENGVTYNVYADVEGTQRPWDLNALPLILPHDEWARIEAAVAQRATLLNRILLDAYGPQRLLAEGRLPPALVHRHAGFLRPMHGMRHQDDVALHFYALDLARAPDGRWWAVSDRTQAPSGAGYALENRAVISRTFPQLLRDLNVRNIGPFFDTMRASLAHWGRRCAANSGGAAGEPPMMVLLTPGPLNETYYEHAYLARTLGLPLVQGSDLTVRQGKVWLKSLSGMQRVHVILRRVDDDYCDPLELRTDSALGVAGMAEAARLGNVLVANSLGSSLLESGALLGFLPGLCQHMLGEPLKMPSVATWWCGEAAALEEVVEGMDRLVIKPSFPQLRQPTVFGADLGPAARRRLERQLRANPNDYVAQELVRLSQAPVWQNHARGEGLYPCATGLRVFACATPKGYVVMPGGLTRVATGPDARVITMQHGGGSKDTWVQARAQVAPAPAEHRPRGKVDLVRDDTHLSSRMAENLFWFGRNAERCDNIARLLRVTLEFQFHSRPDQRGDEWRALGSLCAWFGLIPDELASLLQEQERQQERQAGAQAMPAEGVVQRENGPAPGREVKREPGGVPAPAAPGAAPGEPLRDGAAQDGGTGAADGVANLEEKIVAALLRAVGDSSVPGLVRQQQQLHRTATQLRERVSLDNWRALQRMTQTPLDKVPQSQSEAMSLLDNAVEAAMLMSGYAMDGMNRDLGWRFMSLGRRLERLELQCVALQRALAMDADGELDWLLELSDSVITYRARYQSQPEWLPLLDMLMLDGSNPRAILYQLDGIIKTLRQLPSAPDSGAAGLFPALRAELVTLDEEHDFYGGNPYLHEFLQRLRQAGSALSEQVGGRFFSHTGKT